MSWAGKALYKGISYQSWAALSFFLQHLRISNFSHIQVEASKFQDFNLVFTDGRKIICEAKDRVGPFGFAALKELLQSLYKKGVHLNDEDQIVVIATNVAKDLKKAAPYFKYVVGDHAKIMSRDYSIEENLLPYLPKVVIWKAEKEENILISYLLFAELLDCWIPEADLEEALHSLIWEDFVEGTVKGQVFSKQSFLDKIKDKQNRILRNTGDDRRKVFDELNELKRALTDPNDSYWNAHRLTTLGLRPNILAYALSRLEQRSDLELGKWAFIWEALPLYRYSHQLLKIFSNNIQRIENQVYALEFLTDALKVGEPYYFSSFFEVSVFDFLKQLLQINKSLCPSILEIASVILAKDGSRFFHETKRQDIRYRKDNFADIVVALYENGNESVKLEVINLIYLSFNLVEDDGEHWQHTPPKIFELLKRHLCSDWNAFPERFRFLVSKLVLQFNRTYKATSGKLKFKGWEHHGGIAAGWGGQLHTMDRFFLQCTITPSLLSYFDYDSALAWKFVKETISRTGNATSRRPDFLSRGSIWMLLKLYREGGTGCEAYGILKKYLKSTKGIPLKRDLILQGVGREYPDELTWHLLEVINAIAPLPINIYQESLVQRLALKGHKEALALIMKWIQQPDYFTKPNLFGSKATELLSLVIVENPPKGIAIFGKLIESEEFVQKTHWFDVVEWSRLLNSILFIDFERGFSLLTRISFKTRLQKNEQILLMNALIKSDDPKSKEVAQVLERLHSEFVLPFLERNNSDAAKVAELISLENPREQFIEFAELLVKNDHVRNGVAKALQIAEVFLTDPSPGPLNPDPNSEDPHAKIKQSGEIHTIQTVRGRCAWLLMHCCTGKGKGSFHKIIPMIERLLADENYYVRHMACCALSQAGRVRYLFASGSSELPLLADTEDDATSLARRIEDLAFSFLRSLKNVEVNAQVVLGKSVVHAFNEMRTIDFDRALKFLEQLRYLPDEVVSKAVPLLLLFAEFRSKLITGATGLKNRLLSRVISYEFDGEPFADYLLECCRLGSRELRGTIAWQLMKLAGGEEGEKKAGIQHKQTVLKYFNVILKKYDSDVFHSIYMTVEDHIDEDFETCFDLWQQCIASESLALSNLPPKDLEGGRWWPFSFNGDILLAAYERRQITKFLESLELLLGYPQNVHLGLKEEVLAKLASLDQPLVDVERILRKYVERNPMMYEVYVAWKDTHAPARIETATSTQSVSP